MKRFDFIHICLLLLSVILFFGCLYFRFERNRLLEHTINEKQGYHPKEVSFMQLSVEKSWANCLRQLNIHRDIVFFGNSITRNGEFQHYFPHHSICNLGHGGDDLDGMLRRVGMIVSLSPEKIFLMAGINDLADNIPLTLFETKYRNLVTAITDSLPESKLYIQSILPVSKEKQKIFGSNQKIDSINTIIYSISEQFGLQFIDLYSLYIVDGELPRQYSDDGLHVNRDSYNIWKEYLDPYINE